MASLSWPEANVPASESGGIGALEVDRNDRTDGAEVNDSPGIYYRAVRSNLRSEDMS